MGVRTFVNRMTALFGPESRRQMNQDVVTPRGAHTSFVLRLGDLLVGVLSVQEWPMDLPLF